MEDLPNLKLLNHKCLIKKRKDNIPQYNKEYYQKNKEIINKKRKEKMEKKKQQEQEEQKLNLQYLIDKKKREDRLEYNREYYYSNKKIISKKRKQQRDIKKLLSGNFILCKRESIQNNRKIIEKQDDKITEIYNYQIIKKEEGPFFLTFD
jgi:hypothetical protein